MLIIQNEIDCLNIILTLIIHFFHFNLDNKHCLQKQNLNKKYKSKKVIILNANNIAKLNLR